MYQKWSFRFSALARAPKKKLNQTFLGKMKTMGIEWRKAQWKIREKKNSIVSRMVVCIIANLALMTDNTFRMRKKLRFWFKKFTEIITT